MKNLTYVLRFHRPPSQDGKEQPTVAPSLQATTVIGPQGVKGQLGPLAGASCVLENQFALNHDQTMFFEWGNIIFGPDGDTLSFESIGAGYLLGNLDSSENFSLGTVMWRVTGGKGFFAGATGAITSNFLINLQSNELIDNQFHVIYLP